LFGNQDHRLPPSQPTHHAGLSKILASCASRSPWVNRLDGVDFIASFLLFFFWIKNLGRALIQVNRSTRYPGDLPLGQDPLGFMAVIQGSTEGLRKCQGIPFGAEDKPESDAGAARGMVEFCRVYPVTIEPVSHLGHCGAQIGADAANFYGVGHGCDLLASFSDRYRPWSGPL
jgi:hypothetical protein